MKYLYLLFFMIGSYAGKSQWTSNTAVNLEIAPQPTGDLQSLSTTDGKTWIAWYHNNGGNYDMRAQLLDVNGNKLLGPNGVTVSNITSGSATFVFNICLDAQNNLLVAYQYPVSNVNNAVISKVNTDGSLPWGAGGTILGPGLAPYPAVLSTGETVVAWSNSTPATLYMQKLNTAGAVTWANPVSVLVGTALSTRGQIVANSNGTFTLVFQRKGVGVSTTPYAQRYNSEGVAVWAAPVQISTLTTSGARYYSILAENDTTYFGYYAAQGSRFIAYVQRINPDGSNPWGTNGSVFSNYSTGSDPYQQNTSIAHTPGSPYLWAVSSFSNTGQSQYGVFVQKYEVATGNRLLNVNGKEVYPVSANFDQLAGSITLVNDAPLFASYDANYKIYATRLNATGDFVWAGNRIELSSTTAGGSTPKGRYAFTQAVNGQAVALWAENRGTDTRPYAQNITANGITGILPVSLTGLKANRSGKNVDVQWSTASEMNNRGFTIERSGDGLNFSELKFVATKALNGNSSVSLTYTFTDVAPLRARNYYRLKQTDFDGKTTFSNVVSVKMDQAVELSITSINSIPGFNNISMLVSAMRAGAANIVIVDVNGRQLAANKSMLVDGTTTVNINVANTTKGVYFITIRTSEGSVIQRWVKP